MTTKASTENDIEIQNMDGLQYLATIPNNSVDLILTDPPYIISKETGMNAHYNNVKQNEENNKNVLNIDNVVPQRDGQHVVSDDEDIIDPSMISALNGWATKVSRRTSRKAKERCWTIAALCLALVSGTVQFTLMNSFP